MNALVQADVPKDVVMIQPPPMSSTAEPDATRTALTAQLRTEMRRIQPRLPESWPDGAHFKADLHLDSLDLIELVARMEQQTGVLIDDADLKLMVSIEAMADYLLARMP
jgi:acyl carrier protein